MNDISVLNGVKIETDENGNQHFTLVDQPKTVVQLDSRSWWQKLCDWWNDAPVKPYVTVRDLADPTRKRRSADSDDIDAGSDGKNAVEVGLKISF